MAYTVFPLHGIRADGTCACHLGAACTSKPGKHPAALYSKMKPGDVVHGTAGHGIATGAKSGIFVVDTDGPDADAAFVAKMGDAPDTYTVRTPSGGRHYYFAWPGFPVRNSTSELLDHVDVRGDGGYVVAPGSPHVSGGTYEVERNVAPAVAPSWLLEWPGLQGHAREECGENAPTPVSPELVIGAGPNAGRKLLDVRRELGMKAAHEMPAAVEGENGSLALWNMSLHLVRDLELPLEDCFDIVAHVYNARCSPPWGPKEIEHKLLDARDKSDRTPGAAEVIDISARLLPAPIVTTDGHTYECAIESVTAMKPTKTSISNVCAILSTHPSWEGVLAFDEFRERITCRRRPPIALWGAERGAFSDTDVTSIRKWFEVIGGYAVTKDVAWDAATAVAMQRAFHPLRDYLDALAPATGVIAGLCDAFGLEDEHDRLCMRRFVIGAVRRVYTPGCKMDNMLVLQGVPGLKKSTSVIALFGQEWVSENLTNIADEKKVGEVFAGKWACELAELKDVLAAGNETVAALITRRSERFRAAYARGNAVDRPRTTVLVASTNEEDVLRNSTGADARRFWIVKPTVEKIDISWIETNRDAVWGEAVSAARAGEPHWLEGDDERTHLEMMKGHEERDAWHETIRDYVTGRETVRAEDVFRHLGFTSDRIDRRVMLRVSDTLRRLGCTRELTGKYRKRVWGVPSDLRGAAPSTEEAVRRASADVAERLAKN